MKIEQWGLSSTCAVNPYLAPELGKTIAVGYVYGNPAFSDGTYINTSAINHIDLLNKTIVTRNNVYELGEMHPAFADFMKRNGFTLEQYAERIKTNREAGV